MEFRIKVRTLLIMGICGIFLATTAHARPRTSIKSSLLREENPRQGIKTVLIVPYAFSSDSMGTTLGIGGGMKGYGQEDIEENGHTVVTHRPPFYEGATLGGLGLRFLFAGAVVRVDVGVSDETTTVWAMFGQPF